VTTIPVPDVSRATIEDEACSIGSAGSLVKRNQPSNTMSWDEFQNSDGNIKSNTSIVVYITVNNNYYRYAEKIHQIYYSDEKIITQLVLKPLRKFRNRKPVPMVNIRQRCFFFYIINNKSKR